MQMNSPKFRSTWYERILHGFWFLISWIRAVIDVAVIHGEFYSNFANDEA